VTRSVEVKKVNIELHRNTAHIFEEENIELFNAFEQRSLTERLEKSIETCKRRRICCDLACGTGNLLEKEVFWFEQVVGLDLSREMLKICKAKGLGEKVHFLLADAENLPFRDDVFDIVTMHAALHHIPSPSTCFKEIFRVLPEEGIMYIDHESNSRHMRRPFEKVQGILGIMVRVHDRKHNLTGPKATRALSLNGLVLTKPGLDGRILQHFFNSQLGKNPITPTEYAMADVHCAKGFFPRYFRKQLKSVGFNEAKTTYHNIFSSYFSILPVPLNELSLVDNLLDNLPLIRNFSTHICIWAKK